MTADWTIRDLEHWDERVREKVESFGLRCYPQEFEVCDHEQMLGYMAYSGMPAHYPHWSYGKAYEKLKTMYQYGVQGLPYEMVINSNPAVAYLMEQNSLCLQVLTMAHVYAHNDFFRNNVMFQGSRPEHTVANFKLRGERVRAYMEDPSIGPERVEAWLDAAHALSLQCRRYRAYRRLSRQEQEARALAEAQPAPDPYAKIHPTPERHEPDLTKVPLEPEEDILLFIRDHNRRLETWQRDLLTIVHEQAAYFLPQMQTKIMNEGWASYWHHAIMNSLDLPQDMRLELLVHHNRVVRPHPGGLNPYYIGYKVFHDIVRRHDDPTDDERERFGEPTVTGREKIFEVREVDHDVSFLRRFLTPELMRALDLFEYEREGDQLVASRVADEENAEAVKRTLLKNVGVEGIPVIRIHDADAGGNGKLLLKHEHDGRELELEYAEKTLAHLHHLWGRDVLLETILDEKPVTLSYGEAGFEKTEGHA